MPSFLPLSAGLYTARLGARIASSSAPAGASWREAALQEAELRFNRSTAMAALLADSGGGGRGGGPISGDLALDLAAELERDGKPVRVTWFQPLASLDLGLALPKRSAVNDCRL